MKLSTIYVTSISTIIPAASTWHLQIYLAANYINVTEDRSGTLTQPCKNLARGNQASSMHWYPSSLVSGVNLYNGAGCSDLVGAVREEAHEPNFVNFFGANINDIVESYKIVWMLGLAWGCSEDRIRDRPRSRSPVLHPDCDWKSIAQLMVSMDSYTA